MWLLVQPGDFLGKRDPGCPWEAPAHVGDFSVLGAAGAAWQRVPALQPRCPVAQLLPPPMPSPTAAPTALGLHRRIAQGGQRVHRAGRAAALWPHIRCACGQGHTWRWLTSLLAVPAPKSPVRCFLGRPCALFASHLCHTAPCSPLTHPGANSSPLLSPDTGDQDAAPWEALEVHVQGAHPGDPPDQLHAAALLLRCSPAASQRHRVSVGSPGVPGCPLAARLPHFTPGTPKRGCRDFSGSCGFASGCPLPTGSCWRLSPVPWLGGNGNPHSLGGWGHSPQGYPLQNGSWCSAPG